MPIVIILGQAMQTKNIQDQSNQSYCLVSFNKFNRELRNAATFNFVPNLVPNHLPVLCSGKVGFWFGTPPKAEAIPKGGSDQRERQRSGQGFYLFRFRNCL